MSANSKRSPRMVIYSIFWVLTAFFVLGTLFAFIGDMEAKGGSSQRNMFLFAGAMLTVYLSKILFVVFHFTEDLIRGFSFLVKMTLGRISPPVKSGAEKISRIKFISRLGLALSAIPFGTFLYGMVHGKFNYRIRFEKIHFPDLPESFDGIRVVQISDIHIGGLYGAWEKVSDAIELINEQDPDLIVFTGDLVNNFAEELEGWLPILDKMNAKTGKYSILGNHDYGDYHYWESEAEKEANLDKIKLGHKEIGFNLLLNQSDIISREGEQIAIIGVENWGKPPFAQYGNLQDARRNALDIPFQILLSHDPSHWDAEILGKTNIQLTLSGHTHGMQFGIETRNIHWSPIQMKYPRWGGLYEESGQYLYVNRGLGYIGYPGRVGILPEITVIDLFCKANQGG